MAEQRKGTMQKGDFGGVFPGSCASEKRTKNDQEMCILIRAHLH